MLEILLSIRERAKVVFGALAWDAKRSGIFTQKKKEEMQRFHGLFGLEHSLLNQPVGRIPQSKFLFGCACFLKDILLFEISLDVFENIENVIVPCVMNKVPIIHNNAVREVTWKHIRDAWRSVEFKKHNQNNSLHETQQCESDSESLPSLEDTL